MGILSTFTGTRTPYNLGNIWQDFIGAGTPAATAPGVGGTMPGLPGLPVYPAGNQAVPSKPAIPSPSDTYKTAIQGNLANLPDFTTLYRNLGSTIVGGDYPALQGQEYANIANMLRGEPNMRSRNEGAWAAARSGVGGSPAGNLIDLFESDAQKRARQIQGSQLLSNAVARQVLPVDQWMIHPETQQYWEYLAALRNAAADPWAQFNLASKSAAAGLAAGANSQRYGGTPNYGYPAFPMPSSASPYSTPAPGKQLTPTLPNYAANNGGWGMLTNEDTGNVFGIGNVPLDELYPPVSIPTQGAYPDYMMPLLDQSQPSFDYMFNSPDWNYSEGGWSQ